MSVYDGTKEVLTVRRMKEHLRNICAWVRLLFSFEGKGLYAAIIGVIFGTLTLAAIMIWGISHSQVIQSYAQPPQRIDPVTIQELKDAIDQIRDEQKDEKARLSQAEGRIGDTNTTLSVLSSTLTSISNQINTMQSRADKASDSSNNHIWELINTFLICILGAYFHYRFGKR